MSSARGNARDFTPRPMGDPRSRPGSISGCCWWDILKGSIPTVGLPGERRILSDCDSFWGSRDRRGHAGSLHDLADATADRCGDTSQGFLLDFGIAERSGAAEGQDRGDRRNHAGGQRGDACDRAAEQPAELRGLSKRFSEGIGDRNADARRSGAVRSHAEEQSQQ